MPLNGHEEHTSDLASAILATDQYRERVRHLMTLKTSFNEALASEFESRAHESMRADPRHAEQCARLAYIVAREVGPTAARIRALRAEAQAATLGSRYQIALSSLARASDLARGEGDPVLSAELEVLRVPALVHLERYTDAAHAARTSLRTFENENSASGQIRAHMALADLAFRLDQPRQALRHYHRVTDLAGDDASVRLRAAVAASQANALELLYRFRAAERHFEKACALLEGTGCDHTIAQFRYNAAYADAARGRYEAALRGFAEVEPIFERLEDDRHLAHLALDRAEIHLRLNMPEETARLATNAEGRFAKLGMRKERAQAAALLGPAFEALGEPHLADEALMRAQEEFSTLGLTDRACRCAGLRCAVARRAGQISKARLFAEGASSLTVSPTTRAFIDLERARLDLATGELDFALQRADAVLDACRRVHAPWIFIEAHRIRGRALAAQDNLSDAIAAYRESIEHLEAYRGGVPPDEYMASFLSGRSGLYREIVELLIEAGKIEPAFEYVERAKSRALIDLVSDQTARERAEAADARLRHLRERLNAVYQRIFRNDGTDKRGAGLVEKARWQARALEAEIARRLREARIQLRDPAAQLTVDVLDLDTIRRALPDQAALVEYFVTDERAYAFVVTQAQIDVRSIDVDGDELRRLLGRFRFHITKFDRTDAAGERSLEATRENLARLAHHLLAPVREVRHVKRLVIAPHGFLHQLPFHALPWDDGCLIDRFEVVYAPSAAIFALAGRHERVATGPASVFALPDASAPEIEQEGRCVARLLGSDRLYEKDEATLARVEADARDARYLHLATHGMFRGEHPMLSSIQLADTWLNLYDIYSLDVRSELVVLSTCESGTADVTEGDEILGLTRGFLFAGAQSVLASQWRVHDATTLRFMERLYENLRDGRDAAAAWRTAMLAVRESHPHPYYWAPFFLTGRPHAIDTKAPRGPKQDELQETDVRRARGADDYVGAGAGG